jgi:hypothetical protein
MNKFYFEIPIKSNIAQEITQEALKPTALWVKYYNFDALPISNELLLQDKVLNSINKKHLLGAAIIRLPPHSFYDWHEDAERNVGINMLLNPFDGVSHCIFTENKNVALGYFTELVYQPNTWYLFNAQATHMVCNFNMPRLLLAVKFEEDKDQLNYNDLLTELKQIKEVKDDSI